MNARVCCAAALLATAASSPQQAPPSRAPSYRTGIELVLLDVTVLGPDRMPVHDLGRADFTILEDGKPQVLQTLAEFKMPDVVAASPGQAAWVREVAPDVVRNDSMNDKPITVIVLDDATPTSAGETVALRRMARALIDSLPPGQSAAVVYALDKSRGQEFTADRTLLRNAVAGLVASPDMMTGPGDIPVPYDRFNGFEIYKYEAAIGTLRAIASDLATLPRGRKSIVFLSVGLPIGAADLDASTGMSGGTAGRSADIGRLLHETIGLYQTAQRANVSIYSVSPGGLRAPTAPLSSLDKMVSSTMNAHPGESNDLYLRALSENTGGFAVVETNDYQGGIERIHRENSSYYLIGYVAANARAQGRFRRVDVRVNRPGVTVRARPGYVEPEARTRVDASSEGEARKATANPDAVLAGLVPNSGLPMRLSVVPMAVPGDARPALAIAIAVSQPLPGRFTRVVGHVDIRISAYSPDGVRRATRLESADARMSPGQSVEAQYAVLTRLDVPPGRYMLRVGAVATLGGISAVPGAPAVSVVEPNEVETTKAGSAFVDVDVPDFAAESLSMSGIVLSASPDMRSGLKERLTSLVPIVPSTERSFRSYTRVEGFARVCQGKSATIGAVAVSVRIADSEGRTEFESADALPAARFQPVRAADVRIDVPVAQLARGPHLLTISATRGRTTVSRSVRFETWF